MSDPPVRRMLAWAIDANSGQGHGFIGTGWYGLCPPLPYQALTTATWVTRREARAALLKVNHKDQPGRYAAFPKARVVRVEITVKVAP